MTTAIVSSQNKQLHFEYNEELKSYTSITRSTVVDSIQAVAEAQKVLYALHADGFLAASMDSMLLLKDSIIFYVYKGNVYNWAKLESGNVDEEILSRIGFRDRIFFNEEMRPKEFSDLINKLLKHYENTGYPFASIKLDSVEFLENGIHAELNVQKNQLLRIDSIVIYGDLEIFERFIHNYIQIKPGDPYRQNLLTEVADRIREIPFVQEEKSFEVRYFEQKTKLVLFLKKQQASRFDGILGVLTDEENGKVSITGDVNLNLINALNKGERILLNWRSLQERSQDLRMNFNYPYLFNTPLGFDFDFKLFKKDTTFMDIFSTFGIRYILKRNDYFKIFIQRKNSNLLSRQSILKKYPNSLPPFADSRSNLYGVEYQIERLDYRYNPTKGYSLLSNFAVGAKRIQKIQELEENNPDIYNQTQLNGKQYSGYLNARFFKALGERNTVLLGNISALSYAESLFQNELLRIGGLKSLRGFDEESINASLYSIFTLEYRHLLDKNSYFSLFTDGAYYENKSQDKLIKDTPIGIGAGVSFETAAGIFTLNYALGKQFDNPFYFRAAKVHFGFVNFF